MNSPYLLISLDREEGEVRAVLERRARLKADLVAEGAKPATVARLATPEVAARMVAHERRVIDLIGEFFTGVGSGLK
jgi:hypothetical protein